MLSFSRLPSSLSAVRRSVASMVCAPFASTSPLFSLPRTAPLTTAAATTTTTGATAPPMFCFQCEQTEEGTGCTTVGVCGKTPATANSQDLLLHQLKGLSQYAMIAREKGIDTSKTDELVLDSIFSTLTNVNFSAERMAEYIRDIQSHMAELKAVTGASIDNEYTTLTLADTPDGIEAQGHAIGVLSRGDPTTDDVLGLAELLTYGVKGMAAYSAHAAVLDKKDPALSGFVYKAFDYLSRPHSEQTVPELLGLALECGGVNYRAMELLNEGHVEAFGKPEPTDVRTSGVAGKALLVSGHDLADLEAILQQTAGTGVNVYTHGEMLPAHGYPGLKKYPHLVGNFGGAWQNQKFDFAMFPGSILMTSNCIVEPTAAYRDRIFTTNSVGFDGVTHVTDRKFQPVIDAALAQDGFDEDEREGHTMTGFGHHAVLGIADTIVGAVKSGAIKHFLLVGGCDGTESERSYYKRIATQTPDDTVVLTLGCAKYRFNKLFDKFGTVGDSGIPRLLDVGQCNDTYSAVQIALALQQAFGMESVNDLPLSIALSWFEQKAVAVLLTLLNLGIKDMHIGPALPAFITPNVLKVLVENYNLTPIGDAKEDLDKFLGR